MLIMKGCKKCTRSTEVSNRKFLIEYLQYFFQANEEAQNNYCDFHNQYYEHR